MTLRFIHAADLHLDSPLRGLARYDDAPVDRVRGATRRAFENLVEFVLEEDVALVLLAGDIFDGAWRDMSSGLYFASQLGRLTRAGVKVVLVSGNHDAVSLVNRTLRLPEGAHLLSSRTVESLVFDDLGVVVHGRSFSRRTETENLGATYPDAKQGLLNLGLLHTSLDGRPGHAPYAPCTLDDLLSKGYDYWALGHVHAPEFVHRQDPWVVYPGCLQGRHAREVGPHGATLIEVEDGAIRSVTQQPVDVLRWAHVEVPLRDEERLRDVLERARGKFKEAWSKTGGRSLVLRTTLTGQAPVHHALRADPQSIEAALRALAVEISPDELWLEKVIVETRAPPRPGSPARAHGAGSAEGGAGAMLEPIAAITADEETVALARAALTALQSKLPSEVRSGDEGLDFSSAELLAALIEEARGLLVARLGRGRETGA